jgi:hypothetical protein
MKKYAVVLFIFCLFTADAICQARGGVITGRVVDERGAVIVGADAIVIGSDGVRRSLKTGRSGEFRFDLPQGQYSVQVSSSGFNVFERPLEIATGSNASLEVVLTVAVVQGSVSIDDRAEINPDPASNASAVVLREAEINALPDNEAELLAALQALAGSGAGPGGGEIFVDGFSGARLPPRSTIREIRINQNPLSAEYDRLGFARIEILTRPGTDKFRGQVAFDLEDESFNARNPFLTSRPPFQVRGLSSSLSGPLVKGRLSFFSSFDYKLVDDNTLVNALILDPQLNPSRLQLAIPASYTDIDFSTRFDIRLNEKSNLTARYYLERTNSANQGLGGFDLPSRSYSTDENEDILSSNLTTIFSDSLINELRFQYFRGRTLQENPDNTPTIRVNDSFTSGGANLGRTLNNDDRIELSNATSYLFGKHFLKVGGRLRHKRLNVSSPANFAGTFNFTSLDQYRNTLLNLPGAAPSQFSIAGGDPTAGINQTDIGLFAQDDIRVKPGLTISLGLRYENQTNISSRLNFAPRLNFVYAPIFGSATKAKTIFRGGFGVFYDRFNENLVLEAVKRNGINQQQYVVTDPDILDSVNFTSNGVTNVPTIQSLNAFAQRQTTRVIDGNLHPSYTMQTAVSVEREFPYLTILSATFINSQTRRLLRSRNINAPVNGLRPLPNLGNVFQYESTARASQNQLVLSFRSFSKRIFVYGNYTFGGAESDSDGAGTFPSDPNDLSGEYGRSILDARHRFSMSGNFGIPFGLRVTPLITYRSGTPFNITTGVDSNGDSLFTERPGTVSDLAEPGIVVTRLGAFDPSPEPGDRIIPRNFGRGFGYFAVNLGISKTFTFARNKKKSSAPNPPSRGPSEQGQYSLEFSTQIRNVFNRTNRGLPVGNLSSNFFGQPVFLASLFGAQSVGNRRIDLTVRFSF